MQGKQHRRWRRWGVSLLTVTAVLAVSPAQGVGAGQLDRSFGDNGVVRSNIQLPGSSFASPGTMAVAPTGQIYVLAGGTRCWPCATGLFLTRLLPNGSWDREYGGSGAVAVEGLECSPACSGNALVVDHQGRVVVSVATANAMQIARILPSGSLDGSFGEGGLATIPCRCGGVSMDNRSISIAITRSGAIFLHHHDSELRDTYSTTIVLARLLRNGRLDPAYGAGGVVTRTLPVPTYTEALALRPNGAAILAASRGLGEPSTFDMRRLDLLRFRPDGSLDFDFRRTATRALKKLHGKVLQPVTVGAVILRRRGRIDVLVGDAAAIGYIIRLRGDGRLDRRFWGTGMKRLAWEVEAAVANRGGRTFAVTSASGDNFVAFAFSPSGRLDRSFGTLLVQTRGEGPLSVALQARRKPLALNAGLSECRSYCAPRPTIMRLRGWAHPRRKRRAR